MPPAKLNTGRWLRATRPQASGVFYTFQCLRPHDSVNHEAGGHFKEATMTLIEAINACRAELDARGLPQWGMRLTKSRKWFGMCHHRERCIDLSIPFINAAPDATVIGLIKHEIGHALAGFSHGHDGHWSNVTHAIGGISTTHIPFHLKPKWAVHCNNCGHNMKGWNVKRDLTNRRCGLCRSANIEYWPED
jgi:NAD-dependent SIR2 family protein deacetylase